MRFGVWFTEVFCCIRNLGTTKVKPASEVLVVIDLPSQTIEGERTRGEAGKRGGAGGRQPCPLNTCSRPMIDPTYLHGIL